MKSKYIPLLLKGLPWIGLFLIVWSFLQIRQHHQKTIVLLEYYQQLLHIYEGVDTSGLPTEYPPEALEALKATIKQEGYSDLKRSTQANTGQYFWWIGAGLVVMLLGDIAGRKSLPTH